MRIVKAKAVTPRNVAFFTFAVLLRTPCPRKRVKVEQVVLSSQKILKRVVDINEPLEDNDNDEKDDNVEYSHAYGSDGLERPTRLRKQR